MPASDAQEEVTRQLVESALWDQANLAATEMPGRCQGTVLGKLRCTNWFDAPGHCRHKWDPEAAAFWAESHGRTPEARPTCLPAHRPSCALESGHQGDCQRPT